MEVKKIQGLEIQKNEFLQLIGQLVDQVAYWKEYEEDLRTQVEDLGHDLDDADAARKEFQDESLKRGREIMMLQNKIDAMNRTMRSIQSELADSLASDTFEVLASLFDLDIPFTEV